MNCIFSEYIEAALEKAVYRTIQDEEPIFVSVPVLLGAWATGKTVEEARKELISVIEGWIALRIRMGGSIPPPISGHTITASIEPVSAVE
jgi:predicted RNase H-like HicB family nuclease